MNFRRLLASSCLLAAVGCDAPPQETLEARRGTATIHKGWGCRNCGFTNSPVIFGTNVSEATYGANQAAGVPHLSLISPHAKVYEVDVDEGELIAVAAGKVKATRAALVGWDLRVSLPNGTGYTAQIYDFKLVPDWTEHASGDVPTYGISFLGIDGIENLCPTQTLDDTSLVLLGDERYGADGSVQDDEEGFVSLACRGHALAKMSLLNYDPQRSHSSGHDAIEREATLRMLRADYCGDGQPHTAPGTPLNWTDEGDNPFDDATMAATLEAVWTEEGASCLNKTQTRLPVANPGCAIQPCDDLDYQGGIAGVWASLIP